MPKPRKLSLAILLVQLAHQAKPLIEEFIADHKDDAGKAADAAKSSSRKAAKRGRKAADLVQAKVHPQPSHKGRNAGAAVAAAMLIAGAIAFFTSRARINDAVDNYTFDDDLGDDHGVE